MGLDVEKLRAETPGVSHSTHLLACGSGLMPQPVIDTVINHTLLEAQIGGYEAKNSQIDQLEAVYNSVARLIGAKPHEIALQENATVAWCQAFYAQVFKPGDRVLTCEAEYAANYIALLHRAKRDGILVEVIPSDAAGAIDIAALEAMVDERVALIAITWVPTNGGLVNPAAAVGKVARAHGIPYLLDACQAVGQMPVDVKKLGCDFLSATGRKFLRGPRGTGFLFIREDRIAQTDPVMLDLYAATVVGKDNYNLRDDARRFENWENSYALRAGLGAAVDYALSLGLAEIQTRSRGLAETLRDMLTQIPSCTLRDIGNETCAIVSFTIEGLDPEKTAATLLEKGIVIGTSSPASTPLDGDSRGLPTVLRVAPHYYNTVGELEQLVAELRKLVP